LANPPLLLTQRLKAKTDKKALVLLLSAKQRMRLRGRAQTTCGQEVVLQLPREGPLLNGDLLTGKATSTQVVIKAAPEDLLLITAKTSLELIKAVYHLGNRHVELELHSEEIFLLNDTVLAEMLKARGINIEQVKRPFFPEMGAYSTHHRH